MKRRNDSIHITKTPKLEWVYVTKNDQKTTDSLRRRFGFDPFDLRETRPPLQRPKLVERDDYLFMILLYPVWNKQTGRVHAAEIDFFIQSDRLVTMNASGMKPLEKLFTACSPKAKKDSKSANVCITGDIGHVLYGVLSELLEGVFPMVVELADHIDTIEKRMFSDFDKDLIQELLVVKTNIVAVRKAIQAHKTIIRQLISASKNRFPVQKLEAYSEQLVHHTKELWDTLEVQRDTINALHETNSSLIDFRINQIMKTLTIFSVIVFPLTLLAALFGMNTINMPLVNLKYGFWIILSLMALGTLGMLILFKRKKWL